ncbi:hypothetical protein RHGRI_004186 [Rhododendron griersonianum]|uniref:Uncharacterized protein n=1 Tax=Rhododendron griersonianum TaxID=479676 RepID=A0AAV6LAE2_9ERIC|nr:hypothetical protein RHGRI_004186 [Rhododendron griersonianum]
MTRSKAKATDIDANQGAASKVNPAKVVYNKHRGVATLAVKKKEGKGSKKLPSNFENSVSASLSPLLTPLVSDANSSTGSHSGSSPSSPKRSESPIRSDASYSMFMQAMTTDAAIVEEQLATMARAIEKLTKTMEDKDLQIASLMNKLEAQNMEGTSHDASHPPGFTPKGVIIADQSGKLMMGDQTGKQTDDGNHVLSSNQGDGRKRNYHQYAKRKGGRKMKAMKEVLEVCEPVEQNPLAPITLRDFFPKGYFKEDEVEAVYMVSTSEEIDGDIEQPHALKVAMNKEEADLITTLNEAPLRSKKEKQATTTHSQENARNCEEPPRIESSRERSSSSETQAAEKSFRYIPKSRRKEGQSPFEEVITTIGNPAKCSQPLCKEDLQVLKEDLTTPLPTLGQPSSTKPPLKGFVKSTQNPFQHSPLPEKRTDGFDPKAYKLLANTGYDFNNPTPLGELSPELTGEKVHGLSKAQEELRLQGYRVSPPKTGLGFTPPKPIRISAKGKGKKADVQHITAEEVKEDDNEQVAPRVSVFDRIEAPIPQTSVFNRLGVTKETCEGATLQPKKSIFSRLRNRSASSREHNSEREGKSIELDSAKEDEETRSSIPSRMKRITSLEVNAEGPLKVKRRTIVLTGQPKGNEIAEKEEEMEYTTSYHVAVEEHSSSDSEDDDFPAAPPELEDGGQPTVDDLKELNLGNF